MRASTAALTRGLMKVGKPELNVASLSFREVACKTEGCVLLACSRIVYYVGKAAQGVHCNAEMSEDYNELQSKEAFTAFPVQTICEYQQK